MINLKRFLEEYPGVPRTKPESSVHYGSKVRFEKAREQAGLKVVPLEEIIARVNELLEAFGMKTTRNPIVKTSELDYTRIQRENGLSDERDIVWMKMTKDGYLGVVATSNDVNFKIPPDAESYDLKEEGRFKYNTSGILAHFVRKEWDEDFVLIFPLKNIPEGLRRGDIERAVGNYLIESGVPIIDFYSHNY